MPRKGSVRPIPPLPRAAVKVPPQTAALYRSCSTDELVQMRAAFHTDLAYHLALAPGSDDTRFCRDRLALIDTLLAERKARPRE